MDVKKMALRQDGRFQALMFAIDVAMPFFCAQAHEEELAKLLGITPATPVREYAFNLFLREPRQRVVCFAKLVRAFVHEGTMFKADDVVVLDSVLAASGNIERDELDTLIGLVREWAKDIETETPALAHSTHARWAAKAITSAVKARLALLPSHVADRAYNRWAETVASGLARPTEPDQAAITTMPGGFRIDRDPAEVERMTAWLSDMPQPWKSVYEKLKQRRLAPR